ncbi:hypothetical protein ACQUJS_18850 [Ralstonia pseudosolanacearum]|uniref:Uncharacterized protein n=1 Tax=Ralstonia solanacearum TaxID=305 RepID=A0A0S4TPT7_RALSL|nr:hypothetical protein [Ralstonia pseudosolanacearum]QCX51135.1 hypothetical protein E7Z57_18675 [Ralstonia pseudosolanacearum]CUV12068.1 protein of unknown function [Ralstonia solanacearum]
MDITTGNYDAFVVELTALARKPTLSGTNHSARQHQSAAHLRGQRNNFCHIESQHVRCGLFSHPKLR